MIHVGTETNTYKSAKCKCCGKKLITGERIAFTVLIQNRFNAVSNYHLLCFDKELKQIQLEYDIMYKNLISVSEEIDIVIRNAKETSVT